MTINDLYLKTAFCFMACDGDIAPQEIETLKSYINKLGVEESSDSELFNSYIEAINQNSQSFMQGYIEEVANASLTAEEQLNIVKIAIDMIESDEVIEYDEILFFKQMRNVLSISDAEILERFPDKEDYLLDDVKEAYDYDKEFSFNFIKFED